VKFLVAHRDCSRPPSLYFLFPNLQPFFICIVTPNPQC
jgi:hypothetical protein